MKNIPVPAATPGNRIPKPKSSRPGPIAVVVLIAIAIGFVVIMMNAGGIESAAQKKPAPPVAAATAPAD